jgi:hypothetical protein
MYGLHEDITRAAPQLTADDRAALLAWLRLTEYLYRYPPADSVEARTLAACRTALGDDELLTRDWARLKRENRPANVVDLLAWVRRRLPK